MREDCGLVLSLSVIAVSHSPPYEISDFFLLQSEQPHKTILINAMAFHLRMHCKKKP